MKFMGFIITFGIFAATFIIMYLCERIYIRLALRHGITNKSATNPIASGGGIIIPLTYMACELYSLLSRGELIYPYFLAGTVIIATVSFIDDVRDLSPMLRLVAHFACAALLMAQIGATTGIRMPAWLTSIAVIATVAATNAFNFIDGIKGITGCYSLAVFVSLLASGCTAINDLVVIAVIAATAVFCTFNLRTPERCYCGDTGAITIGYMASLLVLLCATWQSPNITAPVVDFSAATFIIVYLVEFSLTLLRRIIRREDIFSHHHSHLYQRLALERHIPHIRVALCYALLQAAISAVYIMLPASAHTAYFAIITIVLIALHTIISRSIKSGPDN